MLYMKTKEKVMARRKVLIVAVFLIVAAGAIGNSLNSLAADTQQIVRGNVTGDDTPLEGVLVSDGCRVVKTNAAGEYELMIGPDSDQFVFITTPNGYWTKKFYVSLDEVRQTGSASFALHPMAQKDRFDFVFMTDMHITVGPAIGKFAATIQEINALDPRPAFIWAQGDIALQDGMGKEYADLMATAKMPTRNGPGNHELMHDHKRPLDDYERLFGPAYYSFDYGRCHMIVLNGCRLVPGGSGWKHEHGVIDGSEMAWLQADLASQPHGKSPIPISRPKETHRQSPSPSNPMRWDPMSQK